MELGLKSSAFSFQDADGKLQITTEGSGHGLGLSQNTEHYMGLEGKSFEEIYCVQIIRFLIVYIYFHILVRVFRILSL